ncbi:MAG: hypothetical protein HY269_09870 [Deltaproteobacteria bacterium]|nr:hypothetical protein [Deltaproteobacteria bacterium]
MLSVTFAGWIWARVGQTPFAGTRAGDPPVISGRLISGDRERTFTYWCPTSATREKPAALIMVLHGSLGGSDTIGHWSKLRELAEAKGFAICFPNGIARSWRDGRMADTDDPTIDDVRFLDELLDRLLSDLPLEPRRVYLAGMSSGAMMAQRYALEHPERVAALGLVAGSLPKSLEKKTPLPAPVSVLAFHGTNDPIVPFDGGAALQRYGEVLPARDSIKFWAELNQCHTTIATEEISKADPVTGLRVTREGYRDGRAGAEALLYVVEGGGHTWPGVNKTSYELLGMKSTLAINATELMWDFFERHPRP